MRAYDGPALRAFDYSRGVTVEEPELLAMSAIHLSRAAGDRITDARRFAGPFDLPAGRFIARVTSRDGVDGAPGGVSVLLGDGVVIAAGQGTPIGFDLPIDAAVWLAASDPPAVSSAQGVDIVAEAIVPRRARPRVEPRTIEAIPARPGAFLVYADDDSYSEGGVFWTQGTHASEVYVAAAGASTLALTLHVGPVDGMVRVLVDGADRSVTMSRDQTRRIDIPLAPHRGLVRVIVQAPGSFRPSDHEPGSTDRRWLGCQVRVDLQ
jgi:hypothetical protein